MKRFVMSVCLSVCLSLSVSLSLSLLEDESHFLFHCPVYSAIRQKYISEFTEMPRTFNQLLETPSTFVSRKVAMYTFYALKFREKLLA